MATRNIRLRVRRGVSAAWSAADLDSTPSRRLGPGELGYDTDLRVFKAGDGSSPWGSLPVAGAQWMSEVRHSEFNIKDRGAKVDGRELTDVSMVAGSAVLDSAGTAFAFADIGKTVGVAGAGEVSLDYSTNANDGVLVSTIIGVSGMNAVLANPAVNTVNGATAVYGTADDVAIAETQQAAVDAGGGTVFFPGGRTIATLPCAVRDLISWGGVHREVSWVDVIMSAPGTGAAAAGTCDWLSCVAQSSVNPLTGASFHDFGINARFMIRPGGYTNPMKPLNIFYVKRCDIYRMNVWNTPTTSIPFDNGFESVLIAHNTIFNPGRFYRQNTNSAKSGSSGIGIGTLNNGNAEPGLIFANTIIGTGDATTPYEGNNGIFLEGQGPSDPTKPSCGYRIIANYVEGMRNGIADNGSQGTEISDNIVRRCVTGVRITDGGVGGAFPGIDTLVSNNTIIDSVDFAAAPDPTVFGCAIFVNTNASDDVAIRAKITENNIIGAAGRAIRVNAGTNNIADLEITGNKIRSTQRSAIYISQTTATPATLTSPVIDDNTFSQHGLAAVSNDMHAIYVAATMVDPAIRNNIVRSGEGLRVGGTGALTGTGLIQGNVFRTVVLDGTVATGVRTVNNVGWPTLDADAVIWINPGDLQDVVGSTTLGNLGRAPNRAFPDGSTVISAAIVPVPTDWAAFSVQVVWTSALASSGNVVFRGDIVTFDNITDVISSSPAAGTEVIAATMADGTVQIKNLKTGIAGGKAFCLIDLARIGGTGTDTSTNPALVLGVRLIRTA